MVRTLGKYKAAAATRVPPRVPATQAGTLKFPEWVWGLSGRRRYFNKRRSKDQIWHHRGNGWGVRGWHHWLAKDQNKFSLPVSACDGLNRCGFMLSMDALEGVKASECSAYATARIVHKEKRRASAACSGADAFFV